MFQKMTTSGMLAAAGLMAACLPEASAFAPSANRAALRSSAPSLSLAGASRRPQALSGLSMQTKNIAGKPVNVWTRDAGREVLARIRHDEVEQMFIKFDKEGDGQLCDKDLIDGLRSYGIEMTDYEMMLFLREVDQNRDGFICMEDFESAVAKMRQRLGIKNPDSEPYDPSQIANEAKNYVMDTTGNVLMDIAAETDTWREGNRRYSRTVFGPNDWKRYRRSTRLIDNLLTTFQSSVIRALWFDIAMVTSVAVILLVYNHGLDDGILKAWALDQDFFNPETVEGFFATAPHAKLPLAPFTLSSSALGLLLVFRTNGAFQRFFEARALWGSLINYSRNMVRQGAMHLTNARDLEELTLRTIAFARALKLHLRYEDNKEDVGRREFEALLGKEEADKLLASKHRPCQAITDLTSLLRSTDMPAYAVPAFDRTLEQFSNQLGACERIFKTPLPLIYTRHTARFLSIWCLMLPFCLYNELKGSIVLVPVVAAISAFMLGIEELGVQIAEPFSVLPLENMCDGIQASLTQMCKAGAVDAQVGWKDRYATSDPYSFDVTAAGKGNVGLSGELTQGQRVAIRPDVESKGMAPTYVGGADD
mmetsp:Transcript_2223/g.5157  ORF Transcript_2223/g.5157 Transcript_2223/m.5157 type:complete len:593 (-) Transcript_2223:248-2026(-)